jgi:hypothetical protein
MSLDRSHARLGVIALVVVAAFAFAGAIAFADPPTKACGSLSKGAKTLKLRAANMSCRFARVLLRAPITSSGHVRGHGQYFYTASDCEGIVWRRHEADYSQAHNGRLPADAKFVRFVVTRGCVG